MSSDELEFDSQEDRREYERLAWLRQDLGNRTWNIERRMAALAKRAHWPTDAILKREG